MSEKKCPVSQLQERLSEMLSLGRVQHPRCRHFVEELWTLVDDIAWGRSGQDHVQALYSLVEGLNGLSGIEDTAGILSREIKTFLEENEEVFHSHVKTHNCVLGTCVLLAPAPCQTACPAGIDVPTYLTLIGEGRYAEAISVIRQDNPFPWVCGLVCTRPCEFMCVRGRMDSSISIKFLKAFAAEQAMSDNEYRNPPKAPDNGKKVAVVGAGPSGLTAAYYLALKGYRVSVFESLPFAGGMLMVGIPRYRLPREVIDREVDMIRQLGVKFYFNTALGKDITFAELQSRGFDAFFFGIGAHKSFNLGIHGEEDFTNVIPAIELLKQVALGIREKPGDNVVVIGGGNVAIDAARTSLRLGAKRVTLAYRRTREQMPADVEEVEQAEEEGVIFEFLTIPTRIEGEAEKANTLGCQRAEMIAPQEGGRKRPVPVYGLCHCGHWSAGGCGRYENRS